MLILGYIMTVCNYALYCTGRYFKEKTNMLALELLAKVCTIIGMFCFGSLSGMYTMIIQCFLCVSAYQKELKQKRWLGGFIAIELAYIICLLTTYAGISSILIFIVSSTTATCVWWLRPQQMRIVGIFNSLLYLSFQIVIKNWAGLLELFVIVCNITSYLKYRKAPKQAKSKTIETIN